MAGINDFYKGASPSQVAENISKIYYGLTNAGIQAFVQETVQCDPSICSYVDDINELNAILASVFKSKLVRLGKLSFADGLSEELTHDGIHLNKKGYEIWIGKLRKTL